MTSSVAGKWSNLDPEIYIAEVRRSSDLISLFRRCQVISETGRYQFIPIASDYDIKSLMNLSNLSTMSCTITRSEEWNTFAESCYTVRYKCQKKWQDVEAKNYSLIEWIGSEDYVKDPKVRPLETKAGKLEDNIIVTAFDEEKSKRLIIAGLHRASAVTVSARECHPDIPEVKIYECTGRRVDRLFPCDFLHL